MIDLCPSNFGAVSFLMSEKMGLQFRRPPPLKNEPGNVFNRQSHSDALPDFVEISYAPPLCQYNV